MCLYSDRYVPHIIFKFRSELVKELYLHEYEYPTKAEAAKKAEEFVGEILTQRAREICG